MPNSAGHCLQLQLVIHTDPRERGCPCREQGHTVGGPSMQTNKCKTPSSLLTSKSIEFFPSWLKVNNIPCLPKYPQTPRFKIFSNLKLEIGLLCRALEILSKWHYYPLKKIFFSFLDLLSTFKDYSGTVIPLPKISIVVVLIFFKRLH